MITTLPNLAKSFSKLKPINDLRTKTNPDTILGMAIIKAIDDRQPADKIISWVKSQANDCPGVMMGVIGKELTEKVMSY